VFVVIKILLWTVLVLNVIGAGLNTYFGNYFVAVFNVVGAGLMGRMLGVLSSK
jgi:hypothetical protein